MRVGLIDRLTEPPGDSLEDQGRITARPINLHKGDRARRRPPAAAGHDRVSSYGGPAMYGYFGLVDDQDGVAPRAR
jgi:hypothetical protein